MNEHRVGDMLQFKEDDRTCSAEIIEIIEYSSEVNYTLMQTDSSQYTRIECSTVGSTNDKSHRRVSESMNSIGDAYIQINYSVGDSVLFQEILSPANWIQGEIKSILEIGLINYRLEIEVVDSAGDPTIYYRRKNHVIPVLPLEEIIKELVNV